MSKQSAFIPNSFQTPNGYVDDVMHYLTGEEYKVLIYATRRILGFQKRQDRISISQFTEGTKNKDGEQLDYGTGLSIETVKKCLFNLVLFGLMVRMGENDPRTNEGVLWGLQWDEDKVDYDAMFLRSDQKHKEHAEKMKKARSMRQAHPAPQTPANDIERTPIYDTSPPSPYGIETQKTVEKQRNPVKGNGLSEKEIQQANAKVDAMISNSKKSKYQNRDKIPESYLVFADLYHELTQQEPTKRVIQDWFLTFEDWKAEGLQPQHIRAAFEHASREGGFPVGRPGSLTNTAVAMKTKMLAKVSTPKIDEQAVETTLQSLEEKWTKKYVPPPLGLRPNIRKPEKETSR